MSAVLFDVDALPGNADDPAAPGRLVEVDARLTRRMGPRQPTAWSVTFGFGGPAENLWTEVRVPLVEDEDGAPLPAQQQHVIAERAVREAVLAAYGTAYAFVYPPEQYDDAIGRFEQMGRREVLEVSVRVIA